MAKANTECTELSVGFGIMNIEPTTSILSNKDIETKFEGTLSPAKYQRFVNEFSRQDAYYSRFWRIGRDLRNTYRPFANLSSVRWEGATQQANKVSTAIDLMAANTAISVKADSNVVSQPSAHALFIGLPTGSSSPARSENWYYKIAPDEYQELYLYARNRLAPDYPENVAEYLIKIKGQENKKRIGKAIVSLSANDAKEFNDLYLKMCYKVAQESAVMFNDALEASINRGIRNSVMEGIVKQFLRLGDMPYILCGLDENKEFAVNIPDLTSWKSDWRVKNMHASPDTNCGQSVVDLILTVEKKNHPRASHNIEFQVQIRWSHRKLNGNPEAKFYKKLQWIEIPFFDRIYDFDEVTKGRFIGAGGFGQVYEATLPGSKNTYAMKELNIQSGIEDARKRFEQEVKLQSSLEHPNIMPILRSNLSSKVPWFLMPLAKRNLSDRDDLVNNFFQINRIFRQLLDGMNYAHENGIIHRDLKPDNILFDDEDRVQISDFGLGKRPEDSFHLTHSSNNSMGTFSYAAPEQLDSFKDADRRADIYSLGKLLYYLVTQEDPYSMELERVPEMFRAIILKCTKKEPIQRYQTIEEMISDFETCILAFQR